MANTMRSCPGIIMHGSPMFFEAREGVAISLANPRLFSFLGGAFSSILEADTGTEVLYVNSITA